MGYPTLVEARRQYVKAVERSSNDNGALEALANVKRNDGLDSVELGYLRHEAQLILRPSDIQQAEERIKKAEKEL